jgi:hypothetical protein
MRMSSSVTRDEYADWKFSAGVASDRSQRVPWLKVSVMWERGLHPKGPIKVVEKRDVAPQIYPTAAPEPAAVLTFLFIAT